MLERKEFVHVKRKSVLRKVSEGKECGGCGASWRKVYGIKNWLWVLCRKGGCCVTLGIKIHVRRPWLGKGNGFRKTVKGHCEN